MVEAVATKRPRANSDGTSSVGPLILRICGSQREGQIVRLRSPKCTIGSGEHCTLRVRARGVEPLHCVLIRKATRTVVRRWAKDTRLNGASFTDALLNPGDRLSIGPIEFEVLQSGSRPSVDLPRDHAAPENVSGDAAKRDSLVERLETAKDLARKRTGKLLRRLRQANRRIDELTREDRKTSAGGEGGGALEEVDTSIDLERERLNSEQTQLREQQAELRQNRDEQESRNKSIAEQQRALEDERQRWFDEQRQADEARQETLKADRETFQAREADLVNRSEALREAEQTLDEARAEFDNAQKSWEAEREAREQEYKARETDLQEQAVKLESDRAKLDSERQDLISAREDLAAREKGSWQDAKNEGPEPEASDETNAVPADLEQQREEMVLAREELDSLREAVGKEGEAVEADRQRCESLAAEIDEQRIEAERQLGIAAQEAAELRVERESFAEEQQKWEAAQQDAQRQIEQRAEQLDQQREALDAQREELANGQANWEALQAEAEAKLAARAEQLDARERELDERTAEHERTPLPFSDELDFFADREDGGSAAKSTNSGDLFRQLEGGGPSQTLMIGDGSELDNISRGNEAQMGADGSEAPNPETMIVMREESESPQRSVSEILLDDPVIADSFVSQPSQEPISAAPSEGRSFGEDDEEQSIEQYMAGLLARANGRSDATPAMPGVSERTVVEPASAPDPVATERKESTADGSLSGAATPSQPRPVMSEQADAGNCGPRARAPEKAEDLVTLRELANLSAQSALDTHARARLVKSVNAKLAVVVVALATASVLFWRWFAVPGSTMHYYMGLAVILIAVLWAVQYAVLAGCAYLKSGGRNVSGRNQAKEMESAASETGLSVEGEIEPTVTAEVIDQDSDCPDTHGEPA